MSENNNTMSVGEAHKAVNIKLAEAGVEKKLPYQMIYNYTTARLNKGQKPLIPSTLVDKKAVIKQSDFEEWANRYVRRQQALASIED